MLKIDEKTILDEMLKFAEFEKFYLSEWEPRRKRGFSVSWCINPSCNAFAAFDPSNRKCCIQLKHHPKTSNDAFLVAHELMHAINDFDEQYLEIKINGAIAQCYADGAIDHLAGLFGSLLDDPIVDRFLQNTYGFNPARYYIEVKIPDTLEKLTSFGESKHDLYRLENGLFYAQSALQWDSITDQDALIKWIECKTKYGEIRPIATVLGEELYSSANRNGYDTLEKQKQCFNEIFNKYAIDGYRLCDIFHVD
jgi:hypothetical protein